MSFFWTSDNPLPETSGVYVIQFDLEGKVYVGSANNVRKRFLAHKSTLLRGTSNCKLLQHAFNKYFEDFGMSLYVIEYCDVDVLRDREAHHMKMMGAANKDFGYNLALDTTAPMAGRKHSSKTKKLMSEKALGNKGNTGRVFSATHRDNLRKALTGKNLGHKHTLEQCEKNRLRNLGANNHFYGKNHTAETKLLISLAKQGQCSGGDSGVARSVIMWHNGAVAAAFHTVTDAIKSLSISRTHLYRFLNNRMLQYKDKYSFTYFN